MHVINNVIFLRLLWRKCRSKLEAIGEHYERLCHYSRGSNRVHPQQTEGVFLTQRYSVIVFVWPNFLPFYSSQEIFATEVDKLIGCVYGTQYLRSPGANSPNLRTASQR
jgi:hypothetical protein